MVGKYKVWRVTSTPSGPSVAYAGERSGPTVPPFGKPSVEIW
jgi:hypothetical protein